MNEDLVLQEILEQLDPNSRYIVPIEVGDVSVVYPLPHQTLTHKYMKIPPVEILKRVLRKAIGNIRKKRSDALTEIQTVINKVLKKTPTVGLQRAEELRLILAPIT